MILPTGTPPARDGYTIMGAETAVDLERFSRLVVPLLQQRGLFHPTGRARGTLRNRLGLRHPHADRVVRQTIADEALAG